MQDQLPDPDPAGGKTPVLGIGHDRSLLDQLVGDLEHERIVEAVAIGVEQDPPASADHPQGEMAYSPSTASRICTETP